MDAKFTKRFESYKKSLASLAEARERDLSDSFVLSGTSAKFCITFDLAWKVMKDILVQFYDVLFQANAAAVGGAMPADAFYYGVE